MIPDLHSQKGFGGSMHHRDREALAQRTGRRSILDHLVCDS